MKLIKLKKTKTVCTEREREREGEREEKQRENLFFRKKMKSRKNKIYPPHRRRFNFVHFFPVLLEFGNHVF